MSTHPKHPDEMPDGVLRSLGFFIGARGYWQHRESGGREYFHILTPGCTADALIEIGRDQFRRRAVESLNDISFDE